MIVSWFSAGVSSAVATKLAIADIDSIIYIHIDDQHHDTMRFVRDCERWFCKPIEIMQSKYRTVENACLMAGGRGYINGVAGARCSYMLKKRVRQTWEREHRGTKLTYIWGMDVSERNRADSIEDAMPEHKHRFPLIEQGITKQEAHGLLSRAGIKRPAMYDLGYNNNNCIGCVKGGMGYWNHIRIDFPDVFEARAKMERRVGASCINGTYLDDLDPNAGVHTPPIVEDCGLFCSLYERAMGGTDDAD